MTHPIFASVARISNLAMQDFSTVAYPFNEWQTGEYVVAKVIDTRGKLHSIELCNGRMVQVMEGDLVVGALGARAATLEAVGDWQSMDSDCLDELTPAGLFGKITSISPFLRPVMQLEYQGHTVVDNKRVSMQSSLRPISKGIYDVPTVLIVGTSMSAGKTLSGRLIVHLLSQMGLNVVGAKLTGAARYRDVLSYQDAGAESVYDFVDAGLPSTVCDVETYRQALEYLLTSIANRNPDIVVAEAGASPLEPYNGKTAIDVLGDRIKFVLLCAQDPYAVLGVQSAFALIPDLVAGGAANTTAGIELVQKLTGLPALNLLDPASHPRLNEMIRTALEV